MDEAWDIPLKIASDKLKEYQIALTQIQVHLGVQIQIDELTSGQEDVEAITKECLEAIDKLKEPKQ